MTSQNTPSSALKTPGDPSGPTAHLAASKRTVIIGSDDDTDLNQAMTLDFVPSADPTEPTVYASDALVASRKLVGRFQVISILGRGSFGTVYRAHDPLLDREVALKVPRFGPDDRDMMERFHREAKAAARLHHPNIVTLYENGQTDEGPYLVTEFISGVPLSQKLREKRLDLRTAVDWTRQIAEGLHYAHAEGIVHRDVKPANIMLNLAGRPQVMDFGLAKREGDIESGMTMDGQIVGTPNYMSPEQARGAIAEIGPHSDQYSVGVVLYEMLCGRPPFSGDPWTIIARVANVREAPPAPRSVRPDLPRDLEACCLKAMEKDPHSRYPNLQALADDLDHWLRGLPLLARPIGPVERFARWCRHNRMIASLGGAITLLLLIAGIVGPWLAVEFNKLATAAKRDANEAKLARDDEKQARLAAEQSTIDTYTEAGLTADRNGDPREAILWFANAVSATENHPLREKHNRIRFQSWLPKITTPIQAFAQPSVWIKELSYHPSENDQLLTLTLNGTCELLNVSDGSRANVPIEDWVHAATCSPDGKLLVLASNAEVIAFEYPTNKEFDRWNHPEKVSSLQFSSDGRLLVVGGERTVQVRDIPNKSFRTGPLEVGSPVSSAAIARNGECFAVRSEDKQIRVFSSSIGQLNSKPLLPAQPAASNVAPIFIDNDRLLVLDDYKSARCWNLDLETIEWEREISRVFASAQSPDGMWIALAEDFDILLLNADAGCSVEKRITFPHVNFCLSFHPQCSFLLAGSADKSVRLLEIPSGKLVGSPILHCDAVQKCVWSPDGATFATTHWTGDLTRIWRLSEAQSLDSAIANTESTPFVRLNQSGDRWLPSSFDNGRSRSSVAIQDSRSGKTVGPKLYGPGLISDADFVPKSPLVVLACGGSREDARRGLQDQKLDDPGSVRFVNSETAESVFADVTTPSQPIAVRCSPDGQTVVVLCYQGQVLLLDAATGKVRAEDQAFEGKPATFGFVIRDRIRFSARGDQFVIWGCNEMIELRKTSTGEQLFVLRHSPNFIHDAQFSPDGRLIATGGSDHTARLWDTKTGENVGPVLVHAGWVFSVKFSHDGRRLLTASSDKQARIWDVATGRAELATREHLDQVFDATFLPGEELLLVASRDGRLTAWDATLGKLIAPSWRMPDMIYQLSLEGSGAQVIASGRSSSVRRFDRSRWIVAGDSQLNREDVKLLGEILSSQRIHEGGAATSLTSEEWLERWIKFRNQYPDHPVLRMPRKSKDD